MSSRNKTETTEEKKELFYFPQYLCEAENEQEAKRIFESREVQAEPSAEVTDTPAVEEPLEDK
jgi:hypothetical protein